MRKIDADALTKLFRYVIGDIAKNTNMSKEEEHIVRASAMTIEMIADAPTIEDDTICECNLADNAALICEILNADAEGKEPDLVKVVRCKDCLWLDRATFGCEGVYLCGKTHSSVKLDEYCCHGAEMKEIL